MNKKKFFDDADHSEVIKYFAKFYGFRVDSLKLRILEKRRIDLYDDFIRKLDSFQSHINQISVDFRLFVCINANGKFRFNSKFYIRNFIHLNDKMSSKFGHKN